MSKIVATQSQNAITDMFRAGAHFGYSRSRRHPSVKPFLAGVKNRVQVIDLEKTNEQLETACAYLHKLGEERKVVLLVGSKKEAEQIVLDAAIRMGVPTVTERWLGGTFTNWSEIKKRIARMRDLKEKRTKGELSIYTKRERARIDVEIAKLERYFTGIATLEAIPAALVAVDSAHEAIAITEAHIMHIPVISLSNADCNINGIEYPIVGNDASRASIEYFVHRLAAAYIAGTRTVHAVPLQPSA